jgi:hypothetical protein
LTEENEKKIIELLEKILQKLGEVNDNLSLIYTK